MTSLTTHTLHARLRELQQEQRHLVRLLEVTKAVRDVSVEQRPQAAERRLSAARRILAETPPRQALVGRQLALLELLAEELESGAEQAPRLENSRLGQAAQLALAPAKLFAAPEQQRRSSLLDRLLEWLRRPLPAPERPPLGEQARVERVIDGDTVLLRGGWKVRYIGIDAPEMFGLDGQPEAFAREALRLNQELVGGKTVRLGRDRRDLDRFGRPLRYVYAGETFVNAELVRQGLAYAFPLPPDTRHAALFARLEREARREQRGMWAEGR